MNAVVSQPQLPGMPEPAGLLEAIARAASDPNVDVAKMDRLMDIYARISAMHAEREYAAALAEMQPELPVINERGEILNKAGEVQSTYALWEDLNEAIRPILHKFGFSLTFRPGNEGEKIKATGVLRHKAGHHDEATFCLPADGSGSKNIVQAAASSLSYCKRYIAIGMLNITTRGEDDDGRKAGAGKTLSEKQIADLKALLTEVGADQQKFLKWAKVSALSEILEKNYDACVQTVKAKRR
jgi:hypothetical protein